MGGKFQEHSSSWQKIYAVIAKIPEGRVATYGQVARAAGMGGQARLVGYALHGLRGSSDLPWHRVVNATGRSSLDPIDGSAQIQRSLLEQEGIEFGLHNRIDLDHYQCDLLSTNFAKSDHPIS